MSKYKDTSSPGAPANRTLPRVQEDYVDQPPKLQLGASAAIQSKTDGEVSPRRKQKYSEKNSRH
jgi:hypothetical protein